MATKRNIARRLSDLEGDDPDGYEDIPIDVREGVTAPFVTYREVDPDEDPDAEFIQYAEWDEQQDSEGE